MTDDQFEDLLTRHGKAWRAAQPAAPSLSAMAGTPHPARAPWLLPALVAAALLVPVVGTVVLVQRHDPPSRGASDHPSAAAPATPVVVPWADLPAPASASRDQLSPRTSGGDGELPPGTAQCEAGDFSVTSDSATSTELPGAVIPGRYLLSVQRVGTEPCTIGASTPTVTIFDAAGNRLGTGGSSLLIAYSGYQLLLPGDVLQVPAYICGTGIASVELVLASTPDDPGRIGSADGTRVAIAFPHGSTCASGASGTSHQHIIPAGRLASLVPSFSVPSRVRSGQPLDYTVTLTNPGSTAVSLQPCPGYRQSLIDVLELPDRKGATSTGQLNCAAAPASVPAHSSITFRMRLDTTGVPTGDRRLIWDWLGSTATDAEGYAQFPTVTVY
jgi:hypothetical protein